MYYCFVKFKDSLPNVFCLGAPVECPQLHRRIFLELVFHKYIIKLSSFQWEFIANVLVTTIHIFISLQCFAFPTFFITIAKSGSTFNADAVTFG